MNMKTKKNKKIDPILPSRVTSTGIVEDAANKDNRGLYQNLMDKEQYWTYDSKLKDIVVMQIPKNPKVPTKVLKTIHNVPYDLWVAIRDCMKEFIVDDNDKSADEVEEESRNVITEAVKLLNEYAENGVTIDMSDVYTGRYGHKFSYNYDMNRLECVDGSSNYMVGISRPDWEDHPLYWVAVADKEVESERVYS